MNKAYIEREEITLLENAANNLRDKLLIKILFGVDQMGIKKLRGYKIDQMLRKTNPSKRKDRYG